MFHDIAVKAAEARTMSTKTTLLFPLVKPGTVDVVKLKNQP